MSHEVETMAWANEVPWHRLGREIGNDATPIKYYALPILTGMYK